MLSVSHQRLHWDLHKITENGLDAKDNFFLYLMLCVRYKHPQLNIKTTIRYYCSSNELPSRLSFP